MEGALLAMLLTIISGLSTGIGGLLVVSYGKPTFTKLGHMLSFSAGVMTYISFMDLLPGAVEGVGFVTSNLCFFLGMGFFYLIQLLVPEPDIESVVLGGKRNDEKYLKSLGVVTALGISIHNFPEGIAVYLGCLRGLDVGLPLAFAIAAHNIPEGMAVASPIYHATGSKWEAVKWSTLSGACEPVGAIIVGLFFTNSLTDHMVHCMLAAVAGIMVLISVKELVPASLKYIDGGSAAVSNICGMFFVSLGVYLLQDLPF